MKILITGATGNLGNAVINQLRTKFKAQQIAIITRGEESRSEFDSCGFMAYQGNYDDTNSLKKAMQHVDSVLLISAGDEGDRMQQHKNVINTAKNTGVKNIAYTSRSLRDRDTLVNDLMQEHFATEDYIKESGLNYIIFRNALYMDVIPLFVGENVFEQGTISQPAGDGKVAFALREEQGEAMANVLMNESFNNETYQFTGLEAYSFYDIAEVLTELSGTELTYNSVNVPEFKDKMKQTPIPDSAVEKIIAFNTDIKNGQESEVTNTLTTKLGRKPMALKKGLERLFGL